MADSRGSNKYGSMKDDQFQKLLATMAIVLKPVKPEATFIITSGQESI